MQKYIPDTLENKTILITGGAGFIGSNLAFYFQEFHPSAKVIIFDKFRNLSTFENGNPYSLGHFKNLIGFKGQIITGDINNPNDLEKIKNLNFDYIFHQAAISDTTILDQELVMKTNHSAFLDILEITLRKNAVMIYASSAGTYGNTPAPNRVGNGEEPENVYGFSKLCMDQSVRNLLKISPNLPIIGLRYFNVYGEREFNKGKTASMILQLAIQALKDKKVKLFEFGEQKRDFVYIKDVIQANVKAMNATKGAIYNVGSGFSSTYNDIVLELKKFTGEFEVEYIKNPYKFFQSHTEADISSIQKEIGYKPMFSLEKGIKDYSNEIKKFF